MGYTKRWIPPSIPLRNDLPAWKLIFNDLHDNLIEAGLVQTGDTGQLDIDAVAALPADNTYAGYRMYRFNDALQATSPIFIKIEFGCGPEGLSASSNTGQRRGRCLRTRVTYGKETNGAGIFVGNETAPSTFPQALASTSTGATQLTHHGTSYACFNEEAGFFGFIYGVGSRNKPFAVSGSNSGEYYGSTIAIIVQRSLSDAGVPTSDGFASLGSDLQTTYNGVWSSNAVTGNIIQYISPSYKSNGALLASRYGGTSDTIIDNKIQCEPVFMMTPELKPWSALCTYRTIDMIEGTEFTIETIPGKPQNFIALGNETSLPVDQVVGQFASFAMLFE